MVSTDNLKSYFEKARRFDQDRMMQIERSNRIAWAIANTREALPIPSPPQLMRIFRSANARFSAGPS